MTHVAVRSNCLFLLLLVIYGAGRGSTSAAIATDEAAVFLRHGKIQANDVNIRAGSSLNHEILGKVQSADLVTIRGDEGDWYRIALPVIATCYVHTSFVSIDAHHPEQGTISADRVNLRARPTTSSSILGQLDEGERVTICQQVDAEWLAIAPPANANGWIHKQFVTLIAEEAVPQPLPTEPAPVTLPESQTTSVPTAAAATSTETDVIPPSANTLATVTSVDAAQESESAVGAIEDLGRLVARPARHKLVQDHRVVAFLVSERYDLNRFLHRPIRVWGETLSPTERRIPLIRVDRIEPATPPL